MNIWPLKQPQIQWFGGLVGNRVKTFDAGLLTNVQGARRGRVNQKDTELLRGISYLIAATEFSEVVLYFVSVCIIGHTKSHKKVPFGLIRK